MIGRHQRCWVCDVGLLAVARPWPSEDVLWCSNPQCASHSADRARELAEAAAIRRELER